MKTATKVLLGAAGAGVALVTAIGVASAKSSSTTTPAAAPPITWQLLQGHRYTVNIQPKPDVAIDLAGASTHPLLLPTGIVLVLGSFSYNAPGTPSGTTGTTTGSIVYQIDATGPTHNEPQTTFVPEAGISPDSWIVNVYDMGLTSNYATAGAPSPSTATPPGATSSGGPTSGPFAGYGTPYTPPAGGAPPPAGGGGPPLVVVTPPTGSPPTAPPTTPSPMVQTPTGQPGSWQPSTSAPFLWGARWTMTADQVSAFVASAGGTGNPPDMSNPTNARKSFEQVLLLQRVQGILQSRVFFVWAPGEAVPTDWPPDDAHIADGYHVEIVYGVGYALATASIPNPPALGPATLQTLGMATSGFWTQGQPPAQTLTKGDIFFYPATQINPGDLVRMSLSQGDVNSLTANVQQMPGLSNASSNVPCLAFLLFANDPSGFSQMFGCAGLLAWCPNDQLPPEWPADDAGAAGEYHLQFRSGASVGVRANLQSAQYWVAQGTGS